jgi:deoxycytidylate deaminase
MKKTFTRLNSFLADYPKIPLDDRDYKYMSLAEQYSRHGSNSRKHLVGCVIAQRNEIVSVGYNRNKTHPFQAKFNNYSPYLHAEMCALIDALKSQSFNPEKATVYVSRYGRNGLLGCSYPCKGCWAALKHAGVRKIVCYDHNDKPTKVHVE